MALTSDEETVLKRLVRDINTGSQMGQLLLQMVKLALAGSTSALAFLHVWDWLHQHVVNKP